MLGARRFRDGFATHPRSMCVREVWREPAADIRTRICNGT